MDGLGQILGPMVAQGLFALTHSFDLPLIAAALSLVAAAGIVWLLPMKPAVSR